MIGMKITTTGVLLRNPLIKSTATNAIPGAHHQQRHHREQRRIGEPGQKGLRTEQVFAIGDNGVEMKQHQQGADDAQRRQFQRHALGRVQYQRRQDDGEGCPHSKLRRR